MLLTTDNVFDTMQAKREPEDEEDRDVYTKTNNRYFNDDCNFVWDTPHCGRTFSLKGMKIPITNKLVQE